MAKIIKFYIYFFFFISVDEGQRIKGHRLVLSNISSNELKWNPFNGTWISGKRFSYFLFEN